MAERQWHDILVAALELVEKAVTTTSLIAAKYSRGRQFVQTQVLRVRAIQSVQVGVEQRQTAAPVLVDQREGRTADECGVEPEAGGQAPHEGGLARTQVSGQQHHITCDELGGERRGDRLGSRL